MQDSELRKILQETCPVRPGQEERAWAALKGRLNNKSKTTHAGWGWIYYPTWRGFAFAVLSLLLIPVAGHFVFGHTAGLSTADSKSAGVYATAFYSRSADAQVVWLNGMEPASDKPTYLDPTTDVSEKSDSPAGQPDSL